VTASDRLRQMVADNEIALLALGPELAEWAADAADESQTLVDVIEDWVFTYATGGCTEAEMTNAIVEAKTALRDGSLARLAEIVGDQ